MTTTTLTRQTFNWGGGAFSSRGSVPCHHGGEHDGLQADVVLVK